jgi:hypothetical protein
MSAKELADGGVQLAEYKVAGSTPAIGERPRTETQPILDANLKAVALCYGNAVKRQPDARGRLNVKLTVDPDGKVSPTADSGSTVTDTALINCVLGTYKKLRFPKAKSKDTAVHAVFFGPDAV